MIFCPAVVEKSQFRYLTLGNELVPLSSFCDWRGWRPVPATPAHSQHSQPASQPASQPHVILLMARPPSWDRAQAQNAFLFYEFQLDFYVTQGKGAHTARHELITIHPLAASGLAA